MLKKHKNGLLGIIKEEELNPKIFIFKQFESKIGLPIITISVKNSPLKFAVYCTSNSYFEFDTKSTMMAPSFPDGGWYSVSNSGIYANIHTINNIFRNWLNDVVKEYFDELILPDMWEQLKLQEDAVSSKLINDEDTQYFTEEEKQQLKLSIKEFRLLIINNYEPSEAQLEIIDDRLNYIKGALDRQNRLDWKSLVISSVLTISVTLSLNHDQGAKLYELFKQVFLRAIHLLQ